MSPTSSPTSTVSQRSRSPSFERHRSKLLADVEAFQDRHAKRLAARATLAQSPNPRLQAQRSHGQAPRTLAGHVRVVGRGSEEVARRDVITAELRQHYTEAFGTLTRQAMSLLKEGLYDNALTVLAAARDAANRLAHLESHRNLQGIEEFRQGLIRQALTGEHGGLRSAHYTPADAARDWVKLEGAMTDLHAKKRAGKDVAAPLRDLATIRSLLQGKVREDGNGAAAEAAPGQGCQQRLGRDHTTWGGSLRLNSQVQISGVGQVVDRTLRWATLSAPARLAGLYLQKGRQKKSLPYMAGAIIKGLANITGGVSSLVGATISFAEAVVANVVGGVLRGAGAAVLGAAGYAAKAVKAGAAGNVLLGHARKLGRIPFLAKGKQQALAPHMYQRTLMLEQLFRYTSTTTQWVRDAGPLGGFSHATQADIPKGISLEFDEKTSCLKTHTWSGVNVGVYREPDGKIILAFVGTRISAPATVKADVVAAFGIEDPAYRKAAEIVAAFKAHYGDGQVEILGHSLGGALATWAGIKNGVPVTTFNGAGLHVHMRNRLGAELLDKAKVTNINSQTDWLSQFLENRRAGLDASSQIGARYVMRGAKGHKLSSAIARVSAMWAGDQATRSRQNGVAPRSVNE